MELCHRKVWAEWFPKFAPHYSDVNYVGEDKVSELDTLNWIKTAMTGYVIIFALLL